MKGLKNASGLFAGALLFFVACDASAAVLKTQGAWTVGPVATGKHCTMKNTYAGNRALVFGRDKAGMDSIAVDLGAGVLQDGRHYDVFLDVKNGASRVTTGVAAGTRILLMNMGHDPSFYTALARKNTLRVETQDIGLDFALNGTSDALDVLDECAVGIGAPLRDNGWAEALTAAEQYYPTFQRDDETVIKVFRDAPTPRPAPAARSAQRTDAVPVGSLQLLQDVQDRVQKQIDLTHEAVRNDIAGLVQKSEEVERRNADLLRENESLQSRLAAMESEIQTAMKAVDTAKNNAEQRNTVLARENTALKEALAAVKAETSRQAMAHATAREAALQQNTALMHENKDLRQAYIEAQLRLEQAQQSRALASVETAAGNVSVEDAMPDIAVMTPAVETTTWENNGVFGQAEAMPRPVGASFPAMVQDYFTAMQARCPGDFAHTQSGTQFVASAGLTMQKAEMACIDGRNDATAALIFMADDAVFSVVTHEGAIAMARTVLASRDAFYSDIDAGASGY
ncbi:MAG: hypothetical protein OXT65_06215 [Alphaproteobacteria bacterium]|nr:hypothetical protein [Alphaproteobacteria bacterium]